MNKGDLLLCKESFYFDGELIYESGKTYEIDNFEKRPDGTVIHFKNSHWAFWYVNNNLKHNNRYFTWYVWTYFYTPAELRELKINSILDD